KRIQRGMTCDERALEVAYERLLDFARNAQRRIGLAEPYGLEQNASEPAVVEAQIERQEDRTQRPAHAKHAVVNPRSTAEHRHADRFHWIAMQRERRHVGEDDDHAVAPERARHLQAEAR